VKTKKTLSAATLAYHDSLRSVPKSVIDRQLCIAVHRSREWYRLNGKKFRLPNERQQKAMMS
jgi:hypothetical protein